MPVSFYEKARKESRDAFMSRIGFVDRYIDRPLASLIVWVAIKTPVTPNGLTLFSGLLGLLGAFLYSRGEYRFFVVGGILVQLSSIVDGADGMLARAKNMCSEYGSHLDLFLDRILDFLIMAGIAAGAYAYYSDSRIAMLGFLAAGLYQLQVHMFYLTKSFLGSPDRGENGEARAILYWGILICSIANRLDICIGLLLLETILVNVIRLIYFMRLKPKN